MATIEQLDAFNAVLTDFPDWREGRGMSVGLVTGLGAFSRACRTTRRRSFWAGSTGRKSGGVTIRTAELPVSRARLPGVIAALVAEHRPEFYVSLGLATGEAVLRFETTAINRVDFGVADNEGARPTDGGPIEPEGPPARFATWDAAALAGELLEHDLPAIVSHHAGTHLCNLVLYCAAGCDGARGPRGSRRLPASALHAETGGAIPEEWPASRRHRADDAARAAQHAACDAGGRAAADACGAGAAVAGR